MREAKIEIIAVQGRGKRIFYAGEIINELMVDNFDELVKMNKISLVEEKQIDIVEEKQSEEKPKKKVKNDIA